MFVLTTIEYREGLNTWTDIWPVWGAGRNTRLRTTRVPHDLMVWSRVGHSFLQSEDGSVLPLALPQYPSDKRVQSDSPVLL